jgi:hypothetical protein
LSTLGGSPQCPLALTPPATTTTAAAPPPAQDADAALEAHIHQMSSCIKAMTDAAANKPYFYVTDEDIIGLPYFK